MSRRIVPGSLLFLALLTLVPAQTAGPYLLEVGKVGTGQGTVTSSLPGIDCGADCSEAYPAGSEVTLTAVPAPGYVFAGWGEPCSGMASCTVVMDAPKQVPALFATDTSDLTWAKFYISANQGSLNISSVVPTPDGGMLTAGRASYYNEIEVMKLSQAGSLEWEHAFTVSNPTNNEIPLLEVSGGFFLLPGGNYPEGQLIKLNSSGEFVWRRDYRSATDRADLLRAMTGDGSGGAVVAGGSGTASVMRIDSDGNLVWQRGFPTSPSFWIYDIERLADGGYLTAATTQFSKLRVIRFTSVGEVVWAKDYTVIPLGSSSDLTFSSATISPTEDAGSLLVTGNSYRTAAIRLNSEGEVIWGRSFGSGNYPEYFSTFAINLTGSRNTKYHFPRVVLRFNAFLLWRHRGVRIRHARMIAHRNSNCRNSKINPS